MSVDHLALCDELAAEHAALDRLVTPLDARAWATPTPAPALDGPGPDRAPGVLRRGVRHVAHLGVITRGYSFENQGHRAPPDDVRVELIGASGAVWTWGDANAANRVRGRARDFCLVVTRRRHVADTGLVVEGPVATD